MASRLDQEGLEDFGFPVIQSGPAEAPSTKLH